MVLPLSRWRALSDRRYLVADRNRRTPDHPAAGRHRSETGLSFQAFFGVVPRIVDATTGEVLEGACEGALIITRPWPAMMRSVYGDHERFRDTYFTQYPGTISPATARAVMRMVTTGSPDASTTCSMFQVTVWVPPRSNPPWCCTKKWPRLLWLVTPRDHGSGYIRLRHPDGPACNRPMN